MTSVSKPGPGRTKEPIAPAQAHASLARELSAQDKQYLLTLARHTWDNILWLVHPESGLPYDKNLWELKQTSVTNIGLYAADLIGAVELGFITREEAVARADKMMDGLEKFKHWNGFCQSWNHVETYEPSPHDTWISVLDSGNLAGGLLALKHAFPELKDRAGRYVDAMDWSKFYNRKTHVLYGGYNMAAHQMNENWKLTLLGSDSRLASLLAIGSGKADPAHWQTLSRDMETRYGLDYLVPGWQGGGLFMQYISGLFVDDRATLMGLAAARFAYAQMFHARVIQSPVWGWSASDSPDGTYLGWQALKDSVVTPHASSLPLSFFPKECVANLKKLEEMGARADFVVDGQSRPFGFRDALDLGTNQVTRTYLILDQSMLFLSIVNALKDGVIWRYAARDPIIQKGRELIPDYRAENLDYGAFWKYIQSLKASGPQVCVNTLKAVREFSPDKPVEIPLHYASDGPAEGAYELWWRVLEERSGKYVAQGKEAVTFPSPAKASLSFPLKEGLHLAQVALNDAAGKMVSEDSLTFRVSHAASALRREPIPTLPPPSWEDVAGKWESKPLRAASRWAINKPKEVEGRIRKTRDGDEDVLKLEFAFHNGEWLELVRPKPGDFSRLRRLTLEHRYAGLPIRLEVKVEDKDGSVFGFVKEVVPNDEWVLTRIDVSRLKHLWGGNNQLDLKEVVKLMIAVAGPKGSEGALEIKALQGFYKPAD